MPTKSIFYVVGVLVDPPTIYLRAPPSFPQTDSADAGQRYVIPATEEQVDTAIKLIRARRPLQLDVALVVPVEELPDHDAMLERHGALPEEPR